MSIQNANTNSYTDNNADVSTASFGSDSAGPGYASYQAQASDALESEQATIQYPGGDEEEINGLPLEAMVISNSSLCSFMGARSPWPNT